MKAAATVVWLQYTVIVQSTFGMLSLDSYLPKTRSWNSKCSTCLFTDSAVSCYYRSEEDANHSKTVTSLCQGRLFQGVLLWTTSRSNLVDQTTISSWDTTEELPKYLPAWFYPQGYPSASSQTTLPCKPTHPERTPLGSLALTALPSLPSQQHQQNANLKTSV